MNDRELCERFGTTLEEVEADAERYDTGDLSGMGFGDSIEGRTPFHNKKPPAPLHRRPRKNGMIEITKTAIS